VKLEEGYAQLPVTDCFAARQNLLGILQVADDVVEKSRERAAVNGVDVFRVFRCRERSAQPGNPSSRKAQGKHAQGTHLLHPPGFHIEMWVDLAIQIEDLGADVYRQSRIWPGFSTPI